VKCSSLVVSTVRKQRSPGDAQREAIQQTTDIRSLCTYAEVSSHATAIPSTDLSRFSHSQRELTTTPADMSITHNELFLAEIPAMYREP
jgi:hypothetical protein